MSQNFLFDSYAFSLNPDGSVRVTDNSNSTTAVLPANIWKLLTTLTPAECLAVRDGVAALATTRSHATDSGPADGDDHEHEIPEGAQKLSVRARVVVPGPLLIQNREVAVAGLKVVTFRSDPTNVPRATDGRARAAEETILGIVVHTVKGTKGPLREGKRNSDRVYDYARYQATTTREVSWHFTVGTDATVVQSADTNWLCWHAGHVNSRTIGIELVQDNDGSLYTLQIDAAVALIETLCRELGISRRTPMRAGKPFAGLLLPDDFFSGVYGHRNVWTLTNGRKVATRGPGDPGDPIFNALIRAGFLSVEI
jgi:hypothetical protein